MIKKGLFGLASFFLYLLSLLPFRLLYILSDILFLIIYYVIKYRRKVVQCNLKNAFPEKSIIERAIIEKKYFQYLSDMVVECIKMLSISKSTLKKRLRIKNIEEVTRHLNEGKSILMATGHYGNWEWGPLMMALAVPEQVIVIYKPLTNKNFELLINRMRSRFGTMMVSMKQTLRKIIEMKNTVTITVFANDQTPAKIDSHYVLKFLNQPTSVFPGIEKVAHMTNNPVLFCYIDRLKRGYYEGTFKTIVEQPSLHKEEEITKLHTQELENIIIRKPELWLWSHRRWKYKQEDLTS